MKAGSLTPVEDREQHRLGAHEAQMRQAPRGDPHLERRTAGMGDLAGEPGGEPEQRSGPTGRPARQRHPAAAAQPQAPRPERESDDPQRRHQRILVDVGGIDPAQRDPDQRPGQHPGHDPAVPLAAEGPHADRILDDQDREEQRRRGRRWQYQCEQRRRQRTEPGETALGQPDEDHRQHGHGKRQRIPQQHRARLARSAFPIDSGMALRRA